VANEKFPDFRGENDRLLVSADQLYGGIRTAFFINLQNPLP